MTRSHGTRPCALPIPASLPFAFASSPRLGGSAAQPHRCTYVRQPPQLLETRPALLNILPWGAMYVTQTRRLWACAGCLACMRGVPGGHARCAVQTMCTVQMRTAVAWRISPCSRCKCALRCANSYDTLAAPCRGSLLIGRRRTRARTHALTMLAIAAPVRAL